MVASRTFTLGVNDASRPPIASKCANADRNEVMSSVAGGPFGTRSGKTTSETFASGLKDAPTPTAASAPSLGSRKSWLTVDELD